MITSPVNRRYITNFTGTAGIVIITRSKQFLITDFRYIEQAKAQAPHYTIIQHEGPIEDEVKQLVDSLHIKTLGFEEAFVTYAQYKLYDDAFSVSLIPIKNRIETVRLIKTEEELNTIKQAASIADQAFEHILDYMKPGVMELDIATELEYFMRKQGAASSSFDTIVASGWRSALPHGVASNKKM